MEVNGVRLGFRGTDDAHLRRDQYVLVAGSVDRSEIDVAIGVTHAPYRRIIDAMAADGMDLIVAGHTHGGQVCVPFYGALVTNCDLDTRRVKGLSLHSAGGKTSYLHVSAGVGTSPVRAVPLRLPPRGDADLVGCPDSAESCREPVRTREVANARPQPVATGALLLLA